MWFIVSSCGLAGTHVATKDVRFGSEDTSRYDIACDRPTPTCDGAVMVSLRAPNHVEYQTRADLIVLETSKSTAAPAKNRSSTNLTTTPSNEAQN